MKIKILIGALSILAVLLLVSGRFITVGHVEGNDRDVDSFSEISLWLALVAGFFMVVVAFWTFKTHFVVGIIPFGVGITLIFYCAYLLWCKSL